MTDAPANDIESNRRGLVPLIIGVTGHRDLVADEVPGIRLRVRAFLSQLEERFPDRPLQILSPLAEGADRLVAEEALELGMRVAVPLPMPRELYEMDFATEESLQEFRDLCDQAEVIYELPIATGATLEELGEYGAARNRQYAQLGVFLCAHSHILLALWDGKPSNDLGGTAQVVRFHHDDVMEGYAASDNITQQLLADDESDLVYHIVISRDRDNGAPQEGLETLSFAWYTTDEDEPRTEELPEMYVRIFERTSEFNREAVAHASRIKEGSYPLIDEKKELELPPEARRIDEIFCAADWLAIHYQQKLHRALRIIHTLVFFMGLMFLLYSDFDTRNQFLLMLGGFMVGALLVNRAAASGHWHSKHLEYRALAEGLRVQFYWAAAGVTSEATTKFSHDNFLQKQDIELGWIRNVMRVSGIGCDVAPNLDPKGLAFVLDDWIGEETVGGQLKYYRTKARQYLVRSGQIERMAQIIGIAVPTILVFMLLTSSDSIRTVLFVLLGSLLLL
ncbi:MAG: hypothetical protein PVH89_03585, partial [Gammaproteobacteria bacterium]